MTAILLITLFAASGLFALASLAASWRRYGAAALRLRGEFRDCPEWREVRVTTRAIRIHVEGATVLRPAFKARDRHPEVASALPAAA